MSTVYHNEHYYSVNEETETVKVRVIRNGCAFYRCLSSRTQGKLIQSVLLMAADQRQNQMLEQKSGVWVDAELMADDTGLAFTIFWDRKNGEWRAMEATSPYIANGWNDKFLTILPRKYFR
jgi:hypothetical protein